MLSATARKGARISVENRGPQIAEKDKNRIWESFYRGDEARSRESGRNGLGLSIAANTCALHRGTCGFENLEHGVKFWLKIPSQENRPREKKSAAGPLLVAMSFFFAVITLTCRKTIQQLGNLKLGKLVFLSGITEVILLAVCMLAVSIDPNLAGNSILALASMGAVFNVCLWYDICRRYHLRAEI